MKCISLENESLSQASLHLLTCTHRTHTVKPVLSRRSKRTPKIGFQYRLLLNAGQKYCRMLQGEHSAIHWTFTKLPFSIKTFILSSFKWLLKTGFTAVKVYFSISRVFKRPRIPQQKQGSPHSCCFFLYD